MSDVWYPGRVPLCSEEVLHTLAQALENLYALLSTKDAVLIPKIDAWLGECLVPLVTESEDCLNTDDVLNNLCAIIEGARRSLPQIVREQDGAALSSVIVDLTVVHNELQRGLTDASDTPSQPPE